MNASRARQIMESKDTFAVQLDGHSVWIENVDEASGMATVSVNKNPDNTKTVAVDQLVEL